MTIPHEPWLVALSIAIAIQGSFVGLSLARGIDSAEGFRRRLAIAGSAITLATGVWSMHFVAMLAANFPSAVDYLVLPTLISFLICVIVVGIGVYAAHMSGTAGVSDRHGRLGDGPRRQPHALCRHVGGASGRADVLRAFLCRRFNRGRRSRPAPLLCGRSTAGRPARGCSSARSRSAWRFPGCTTRRWPGCASTRCATTFRASSAPNRRCRATRLRCSRRSLRSACPAPFCSRSCRMRACPEAPRRLRAETEPAASLAPTAAPHLEPTPFQKSPSAELPHVAPPERAASIRVEKDGRARDIAVSDIYADPRQRPLHLCPRRREGIFLQPLDQRARSAARSEGVLEGPPQLHRLGRSHRAGQTIGRSRRRRTRVACALQHPDCARPLSSGQAQDRRARRLKSAASVMKCVIGPDAFRAPEPSLGAFSRALGSSAIDCAACLADLVALRARIAHRRASEAVRAIRLGRMS